VGVLTLLIDVVDEELLDRAGPGLLPLMALTQGDARASPGGQTVGGKLRASFDPVRPPERVVNLFRARLGDRLPEMGATFAPLRESVLEIARDEDLWTDRASRGRHVGPASSRNPEGVLGSG
jgi:hypothetical protein